MSSSCPANTGCCGPTPAQPNITDDAITVKEAVRKAYADVAVKNSEGLDCGNVLSCCGAPKVTDIDYNKELGYSEEEIKGVSVDGANMGLGCGNPTALAALKPGEVVLDLGSGGGFDCFLASKRVGPSGHVIGVDMTPEMISKARKNGEKGGYKNVEFRLGEIEHLPVADSSVDVIISNCVINLSTDKEQVLRECARVLRKGGRIAISDIVATSELPQDIKNDLALYSGCMAGATPIDKLQEGLKLSGFVDIKIDVKEATRNFIKKWSYDSGAEQYVASANIEAMKG